MYDVVTVLAVAGTFLVAGTVKGVIGLGLPTVGLALLTAALGLPQAMAILLMPSFITNVWQAVSGGNGGAILRRIWPFLMMATLTVWLGTAALTRVDLDWLSALLGVLLIVYSVLNLAGFRFAVTMRQEAWAGPLAGTINGILTGMTGSFVMPGVLFLQAIGLSRDMLIQAMGMLFMASTLALAAGLQGNGLLTPELGKLSALAVLPALAGMVFGRRIRQKLPEPVFRRVFFTALLMLGGYIIVNALSR